MLTGLLFLKVQFIDLNCFYFHKNARLFLLTFNLTFQIYT